MIGPEAFWPRDESIDLDSRPIGAVVHDRATRAPDAIAARWCSNGDLLTLTYAALADQADAFARRLRAAVRPGRSVAVCAATSIDWLLLEYGAALSGIPLVPVNPAFTDAEIEHVVTTADASVLFADEEFRGAALRERLEALAPRAGVDAVRLLRDWRALVPAGDALPDVEPTDPFLIQFTSGTTGRPKGAVLSHRAAFNCARLSMMRLGGTDEDRWLNVLPMHHVGGSVSVVLAVLSVGASVTLLPAFEPGAVLELMARTQATILGGVPTMQLALLEHESFARADLSALRIVQSGGTTVPPSLIRRVEQAFGAAVVVAYGQSESPNAIQTQITDDEFTKAQTIGTPLPHRDVRIADAGGQTMKIDEIGELLMRSPMVMDRYLAVDAAAALGTLDAQGWLHTGDLCSMDERGVVTIHGRVRDVIIRGGENIYPAEVEEVMLRHSAIADVAVVGVADDRWGEVPVACYRPGAGAAPAPADLERHARASLAPFKVPRRWVRCDAFPLTASGKVKKFELRAQLERPR